MNQATWLNIKNDYWSIRRQIMERWDYVPHFKLARETRPGAIAFTTDRTTVMVSDAAEDMSEERRHEAMWHCLGLMLFRYFQPENDKEERTYDTAELIRDEYSRVRRFLSDLEIGPKFEHGRSSDAANVATNADRTTVGFNTNRRPVTSTTSA